MKKLFTLLFEELDIRKILGHELTWALLLIGSLLVFFVHAYINDKTTAQVNCDKQNEYLQREVLAERKARFDLYDKLLHLQDTAQIIEKQRSINDSLKKQIVKKAKKLIKK